MTEQSNYRPHILLVEDEDSLAIGLEFNFQEEGYAVTWAKDGRQAMDFLDAQQYDLVVLDIMLPHHDGFEIAAYIRERWPQLPVLMLTARTSANDRVQGLEIGADDYVTKPFHLPELLLRIQNMLKRKQWYKSLAEQQPVYQFGPNEVNFRNLTARAGDCEMKLTQREAMLLKYMVEHKDTVVSRKDLLAHVWNIHTEVETRTVDNFIARLRKYFEVDPANPRYFKSIRSAGYMFTHGDESEKQNNSSAEPE